ncbi:DUF5074 domain-containing protein [Hymenobacter sp. BT491]|uniref:DUF5074 domain-containing protein n=1 Tax=Hymenobacter sp. BT491 TaxID=2766779 RepID=UPI001653DE15|nr:DUF5074 domain-containing protein [Hymenobacter sp. BT491]MBC6990905.1 hypothetical protein [Hymenobacter sp. BT491]
MFRTHRFPSFLTRAFLVGVGAFTVFSCNDTDEAAAPLYNLTKDGSNVFVLNEGAFGTPNAEVSLFSKTSRTVVDNHIFNTVNQRELGDVAQSMLVVGNRGYIVANNSKKLEVVNLTTFQSVATVTGLEQPRYAVAVSADKAYVSEWVKRGEQGRVAVLDLRTNTITKTIAVGRQPEHLLLANGKVYVSNSDENTLSVINPATDAVESAISVQDGPNDLVQDKAGNVWVLCTGITRYQTSAPYAVISSTPGNLIKFSPAAPTAPTVLPFAGSPSGLHLNGAADQLYYSYKGGVYRLSTTDAALPATPLIRRSFYGLGVDPQDNTIYGSVAPYTAAGKFIRYQANGTAIDSFNVNLLPNGFIFY